MAENDKLIGSLKVDISELIKGVDAANEILKKVSVKDIKLAIDKASEKDLQDIVDALNNVKTASDGVKKSTSDAAKSATKELNEYQKELQKLLALYNTGKKDAQGFVNEASKLYGDSKAFNSLGIKEQIELFKTLQRAEKEHSGVIKESQSIQKKMMNDAHSEALKMNKVYNDSAKAFAEAEQRKRNELKKTAETEAKIINKDQNNNYNIMLKEAYAMNKAFDKNRDIQNTLRSQAQNFVQAASIKLSGYLNQYDYGNKTELNKLLQEFKSGGSFKDINSIPEKIEEYRKSMAKMLVDLRQSHKENLKSINDELSLTEQMAKFRETSEQRVKNERKANAEAQAKAINSGLDKSYKDKLSENEKESNRLYNIKEKALTRIVELQVKLNKATESEREYINELIAKNFRRYDSATRSIEANKKVLENKEKEVKLEEKLNKLQENKIILSNKQAAIDAKKNAENEKQAFQSALQSNMQSKGVSVLGSGDARGTMGQKFTNSLIYGTAYRTQSAALSGLQEGIKTIKQYEVGINDLRRTLNGATNSDLKQFGQAALEFSKEFGVPLQEVQKAMTELARAGVDNKDDLMAMTKAVLTGVNTTEVKSSADMVAYLVSAQKQLGMSMKDSMNIIDSWNKLADKYAVGTDQFADATSKAGSASKALGLDLHDINAMTVILGEATQASGKQIGDALKALETRILRPETVKTLESFGIAIKKNEKEFLTFEQIMNNVNARIAGLEEGSIELSQIMDTLGGSWR